MDVCIDKTGQNRSALTVYHRGFFMRLRRDFLALSQCHDFTICYSDPVGLGIIQIQRQYIGIVQ